MDWEHETFDVYNHEFWNSRANTKALPKLVIAASNIMTLRVNKLSSFTFTLNWSIFYKWLILNYHFSLKDYIIKLQDKYKILFENIVESYLTTPKELLELKTRNF